MFELRQSSWKRLAWTVLVHALVVWAVLIVPRRPAVLVDSRPLDVRLIESLRVDASVPTPTLPVPSRPAPNLPWVPLPDVPASATHSPLAVRVPTEDVAKPQPPAPIAVNDEPSRPSVTPATLPTPLPTPPSTVAADPSTVAAAAPARTVDVSKVSYLHAPQPQYPLPSRRAREEGRVDVQTLVDTLGAPQQVHVARSSGFERLDAAALAAVRTARFKPHTENGVPRAFWVVVPIVFELDA